MSQTTSVIVKAGYLLRTAHASGQNLALTGDLNATASIEVIGAPNSLSQMSFNGKSLKCNHGRWGSLSTSATYQAPKYSVPDLNTLKWKVIDSLPEVQSTYDD
ncbi:hypothetical protein LTR04_003794, partial [Oleoguttula sp. CCFEE 6159]